MKLEFLFVKLYDYKIFMLFKKWYNYLFSDVIKLLILFIIYNNYDFFNLFINKSYSNFD